MAFFADIPPAQFRLLSTVLLGLLVVFVVPRLGVIQTWRDVTTDPATGHTVGKDLFKATAFVVGAALCCFIAYADYEEKRPISNEPALFLLGYSLGASGLKAYENLTARKTRDADGALTAPPPGPAPPLMQQGPLNPPPPNAPAE